MSAVNHSFDALRWTNGVGDGKTTACVSSLASLLDAERRGLSRKNALREFSDKSSCICPVIRRLAIRINDRSPFWPDADEATAWMHKTAPLLLDTRGSIDLTRTRAFMCADAAVRELAPVWFDLLAQRKPKFAEWAAKLRGCDPVIDAVGARAAQDIANEARANAANAANAADAAYAAYAAAAAAYAANAADAAYAYAAYAADAAYAAYAYAAAAYAANAADAAYAYAAAADAADAADVKITKPILLALMDRLIAAREAQP